MDVIVTRSPDGRAWILTDLLGRPMGAITEEGGAFSIEALGEAVETMTAVKRGPHRSLDDALAEIERRTRGVCRRSV